MPAGRTIVVDSWAWLELFRGSENGRKVEQELAEASRAFTSAVSLAEVVSASVRRRRPTDDKIAVITSQTRVMTPTSDDAVEAGLTHAEVKAKVPNFSLADGFVLQLARKVGARVLTGDPDFNGIAEATVLE